MKENVRISVIKADDVENVTDKRKKEFLVEEVTLQRELIELLQTATETFMQANIEKGPQVVATAMSGHLSLIMALGIILKFNQKDLLEFVTTAINGVYDKNA